MEFYNFHYGFILANQLFGIEINQQTYEELALIAWNLIGNKRVRLFTTALDVNCDDGSAELPCNADIIEAVTRCGEDYQYVTNYTSWDNYQSAFTEAYIETRKIKDSPLYISGGFVDYQQIGNTIYVNPVHNKVRVLYKGVMLDDEGLPEITEKEGLAIAHYIAYITQYKKSMITQNGNSLKFAKELQNEWKQKCDAARVDSRKWSQNDMNNILDARTNWNRKIFNKSYKPFR